MSNLVPVYYIGKRDKRIDNDILRTGRVWTGYGSCIEVPQAEAARYLAHKDIFSSTKPEARKTPKTEVTIPEVEVKAATQPEGEGSTEASRDQLIQGAVLQLNPKNKDHYTAQGKPRANAISDLLGMPVKAAEVDAAVTALKASGALQ